MTQFFWVIFAHAIGDCALQTKFMGEHKHKYPTVLMAHSITWTGCIGLALLILGIPFPLWKILFLLIGHACMDLASTTLFRVVGYKFNFTNTLDQCFHLGQLWMVFKL